MIQTIVGIVVAKSGQQTVKVKAVRTRMHPIYRKRFTITKAYLAHDPRSLATIGDKVRLLATKPISKLKKWQVESVIEKAVVMEDIR